MEKFISIANDLQVFVREYNGTLMLELRGQFKPQQVSASKVQFVLHHAHKIDAIVEKNTDGHYQLDNDSSILVSEFSGTKMYELRGQFRPARLSVNKIKAILKYPKELTKILADNSSATVQAESVNKAKVELNQNAGEIGTDKQSAKDNKDTLHTVKQETSKETMSIIEYLTRTHNLTMSQALQFKSDADAVKMYQEYVKSVTTPVVAKVLSFKETLALQNAPSGTATEQTKQKTKQLKQEAKQVIASINQTLTESPKAKGRGKRTPISFTIKVVGNDKVDEQDYTALGYTDAYPMIENKRLKNTDSDKESKLITVRPYGTTSAKHYFEQLVKQGYIYNVKQLSA